MEGTRFTEAKLKAAQEYAASSELPVPRNVLIPRTKVSCTIFILTVTFEEQDDYYESSKSQSVVWIFVAFIRGSILYFALSTDEPGGWY